MSTILVAGATGWVGSEICQRLSTSGKGFNALVRESSDPGKVYRLKSFGAEAIQGDLRDRASLDRACRGVSAVVCTVSSMPFSYQPGSNDIQKIDLEGVVNLIEAAKANHVSRFIYTSFSGNIDLDFPLRNAKREVERRLKESGLVYTIFRPSYFMETWLSPVVGFDAANAKAVIYGTGQNPISWISLKDVAQFAVASLDHSAAKNAVLELGGPQAMTPLQVVKCFEEVQGRSFELQFVSEEVLRAQQSAATDPMQQSFSGLMRGYALGDPIDMATTLETFAVRATTVKEYARHVLTPA